MALTVSTKDKHQIEPTYLVAVNAEGWHRFRLVNKGQSNWKLYNDCLCEVMQAPTKASILDCLREAAAEYILKLSNQTVS